MQQRQLQGPPPDEGGLEMQVVGQPPPDEQPATSGVAERRSEVDPNNVGFSEPGEGKPDGGDEQPPVTSNVEDLEGPQTTTADCNQATVQDMKKAQVERDKGSQTRSSFFQKKMKLTEIKVPGWRKASEFKCAFHPNNGWTMTNGKNFGFRPQSSKCPDCEKCIKDNSENPSSASNDGPSKPEGPQGDGEGNTPEDGSSSTDGSESHCGKYATAALKLFTKLQSVSEEDATRIMQCIEKDSGATPDSSQGGRRSYVGDSMTMGGKRKKSKSKRTRRRSRKTKRNKRKLKKRKSRKK